MQPLSSHERDHDQRKGHTDPLRHEGRGGVHQRQESDFAENITTTAAVGSIDSIVALTTVGLNEGARRSGSERRYTEDDVWDIFDEEPHLVLEVSQLFVESISPLTEKLGGMVKNGRAAAKRR